MQSYQASEVQSYLSYFDKYLHKPSLVVLTQP
jgi:hypothetical protein